MILVVTAVAMAAVVAVAVTPLGAPGWGDCGCSWHRIGMP